MFFIYLQLLHSQMSSVFTIKKIKKKRSILVDCEQKFTYSLSFKSSQLCAISPHTIIAFTHFNYSHICTCRAISMQCGVQEAMVAASSTQKSRITALKNPARKKLLKKNSSYMTLEQRYSKCCNLMEELIQRERTPAAGLLVQVPRLPVITCFPGPVLLFIPFKLITSTLLFSHFQMWEIQVSAYPWFLVITSKSDDDDDERTMCGDGIMLMDHSHLVICSLGQLILGYDLRCKKYIVQINRRLCVCDQVSESCHSMMMAWPDLQTLLV